MHSPASESEKTLTRRIKQMILSDALKKALTPRAEEPSDELAPYQAKFMEGPDLPFLLIKDRHGEIFELEIRGDIDPGAWEEL